MTAAPRRATRGPARAIAVALALAALPAASGATEPFEALRLTRLSGGEPAAEFSVPTPDGPPLALTALRGKVVVLNFWATWCEPCLEEMPALDRVSRAYGDRGLAVVAVSVDREGGPVVRTFLRRHAVSFQIGLDAPQVVARLYRIWALPSTVILSRQGIPLFSVQGAREWDSPVGHALFEGLLGSG